MPKHFADQMIDDAVSCIRATDLIAESHKARLIAKVRALRQPQCAAVQACVDCAAAVRCEDRIGAILNGEVDEIFGPTRGLHLIVSDAA